MSVEFIEVALNIFARRATHAAHKLARRRSCSAANPTEPGNVTKRVSPIWRAMSIASPITRKRVARSTGSTSTISRPVKRRRSPVAARHAAKSVRHEAHDINAPVESISTRHLFSASAAQGFAHPGLRFASKSSAVKLADARLRGPLGFPPRSRPFDVNSAPKFM